MTASTLSEEMLQRIMAIDWDAAPDFDREYSHVQLFREFLRRSAVWAKDLHCLEKWPLFDIAEAVDATIRAKPELLTRLHAHFADPSRWTTSFTQDACERALHWSALREVRDAQLDQLDDPYEPLIQMYERGGVVGPEHANFQVDSVLVTKKTWVWYLRDQPFAVLDPDWLDTLDIRDFS